MVDCAIFVVLEMDVMLYNDIRQERYVEEFLSYLLGCEEGCEVG